jgi:hypothetical protein
MRSYRIEHRTSNPRLGSSNLSERTSKPAIKGFLQYRLPSVGQFRVARRCKPIREKSTAYHALPVSPRNTAATRLFIFRSGFRHRAMVVRRGWQLTALLPDDAAALFAREHVVSLDLAGKS